MLHELYEYALRHELAALPGFKAKRVKCYLMLSSDGSFLGIDPCTEPTVYCPDIGTAANGPSRCNILIEKAHYPLCIVNDPVKDKNNPVKHRFFLDALAQGAEHEPLFGVLHDALENEDKRAAMAEALTSAKYKPSDVVGFRVAGQALEKSPNYLDWWNEFRRQFAAETADILPRCMITGQAAPALATVPKIPGLINVGGHTAGDAFLCFDKDAFCSYGLEQSFNAPVSEKAMTAVNAALTELIASAPTFGGARLVHWYSGSAEELPDLIPTLLPRFSFSQEDEADEDDDGSEERDALAAAKELIDAVHSGTVPRSLPARYHIMPLSGANGRVMVRGWYEGSYEQLYRSISAWFDDLRLITAGGRGLTRPPKLKRCAYGC